MLVGPGTSKHSSFAHIGRGDQPEWALTADVGAFVSELGDVRDERSRLPQEAWFALVQRTATACRAYEVAGGRL